MAFKIIKSSETDQSSESGGTSSDAQGVWINISNAYGRCHCCFFCNKMQTKLSKHVERCHADEIDVARLLAMKKGSEERKNAFQLLPNKGNYYHNKRVFASDYGEIIPVRRPSNPCDAHDFVPCPSCLGYFPREELRKHVVHSCIGRDLKSLRPTSFEIRMQSDIVSEIYSQNLKHVPKLIQTMRQDSLTMVIKHDDLIRQLGENFLTKLTTMDDTRKHHYVGQKMRESARLLVQFRKTTKSDASMDDLLHHQHNDSVVEAVHRTAGDPDMTTEDSDGCKHPSVALKLGHDLRKLAMIKEGIGIKKENKLQRKEAVKFLKLMDRDWKNLVSSPALSTISARRLGKVEELPDSEDISNFSSFLAKEIETISTLLSTKKV